MADVLDRVLACVDARYADAVELLNGSFNGGEASQRLALAESGVHEESGTPCLEQRDVARASGRKDGYPQADRSPRRKFSGLTT